MDKLEKDFQNADAFIRNLIIPGDNYSPVSGQLQFLQMAYNLNPEIGKLNNKHRPEK